MTDEKSELYQQVILEHNKNPRNFKKLAAASHAKAAHSLGLAPSLTSPTPSSDLRLSTSGLIRAKAGEAAVRVVLNARRQDGSAKVSRLEALGIHSEDARHVWAAYLEKTAGGLKRSPSAASTAHKNLYVHVGGSPDAWTRFIAAHALLMSE